MDHLEQGCSIYRCFHLLIEVLFRENPTGFRMCALGNYPEILKTDISNDLNVVGRENVAGTEPEIHELELSVGFIYSEVNVNELRVRIYIFEKSGEHTLVPYGDWV